MARAQPPASPRSFSLILSIGVPISVTLLAQLAGRLGLPAPWGAVAVLIWAGLIPGNLLVTALLGRGVSPFAWLETAAYSVGAGIGCLVGMLLLLNYLPGPLAAWHLHVAANVLTLALALWVAWKRPQAVEPAPPMTGDPRLWAVGLVVLLGIGGILRFWNLGYAEFHGDEARAVLRAAAVIQGYDDVLLLHKKGPAEILIPTAGFVVDGHLTETSARLPFAVAGLAALVAVWLLGARLGAPLGGWIAAMLLAVDGYFIGFSRIVQYQSVVILCGVLVMAVMARLLVTPAAPAQLLTLAALFLATGLWGHYEGALVGLPALFLFAAALRRHPSQARGLWRGLAWGVSVGAALLALFYLPFIRHPQFGATMTYLVTRRIGGDGFPVNNTADFFNRTTVYSSTYYLLFLIGVTVVALLLVYRQVLNKRIAWLWGGFLVLGLVVSVWQPTWQTVGERDLLLLWTVVVLLPVWLRPGLPAGERSLWLWFGANLILMLFLTGKPRTHVYVFFTPWALIAGWASALGWQALRRKIGLRPAAWAGAAAALTLTAVFGIYTYLLFAYTQVEILRTWDENWPAGYWTTYDAPDNRALFGFPIANGWKVVGRLMAAGEIQGDYVTNEVEFWSPIWYTHGRMRCPDEADWFFQISNPQPDPAGYKAGLQAQIAKDFQPWGQVEIDGDPRMIIHKRSQEPFDLRVFPLEDYAAGFDAHATPDLPLGYPVVEPPIEHPLHINLGDLIWLEGYALDAPTPLQPGDTIQLTLYWRGQQPIPDSYKVFNQSYFGDGIMVAQKDGYPVCGSRGTWLWDPGELIADVHTIPVSPDAPPGLYPLYTGLYIEESLDRLQVLDEQGKPVADQIHLTDIRIGTE